ncbi:YoaK family protein [Bradyrhizobium genosp. A]|uniref:YoaK family protein n=1 Tax=Bradyrhizobium genosp. A TaxID=83626 RepID=UPI003CF5C038
MVNRSSLMNDGAHPDLHNDSAKRDVPVPSVGSLAAKLLLFLLGVIAGSVDVIGFLGLGGLFTAHITGNLVFLAARLVAGEQAPLAYLIAVPVFIIALALTTLLAAGLARIRIRSLLPLLFLQFLLLLALFNVCVDADRGVDPASARMIFAGMLGVCAMAVQNALVRISLRGASSTAAMTTNITIFTMDVVGMLLSRDARDIASARERAGNTWPAIAGFLFGCTVGAASEAAFGLQSLKLPAALALFAIALGLFAALHDAEATNLPKGERYDER